MDTMIWLVIIIVAALLVGAAAAWLFMRQRRQKELRDRFGPEYDRTVSETGDRRLAERELEHRQRRVEALDIRPLSADERARFADAWRGVQARFVDDPAAAIADADELVNEVMRARGYPVADFEQRAADVSVDHPRVVENYRAAQYIARRSEQGEATTEELRQAVIHYRALFDDLLETDSTRMETGHERQAS